MCRVPLCRGNLVLRSTAPVLLPELSSLAGPLQHHVDVLRARISLADAGQCRCRTSMSSLMLEGNSDAGEDAYPTTPLIDYRLSPTVC